MSKVIFIFLLTFGLLAQAQVPNPFHRSTAGLAKHFEKKYADDSVRTDAIYQWITHYMKYDYKSFSKYRFHVNSYSMSRVLYRRKAMCYGLSKLFAEICTKAGIECTQVGGYTFENPDDPYIHYYYEIHAWNALKAKERWHLFDLVLDNGFVKPKRRLFREILYNCFSLPYTTNKMKFRHRPTHRFAFQTGKDRVSTHYPLQVNALLVDQDVSIQQFEEHHTPSFLIYEPDHYPTMLRLGDLSSMNESYQLRRTADQAVLFNNKNHYVKAANYYNAMVIDIKKGKWNASDADTVLKYAALFNTDNKKINGINNARINEENSKLSVALKKALTQAIKDRNGYLSNEAKAGNKLLRQQMSNERKSEKLMERQLKLAKYNVKARVIDKDSQDKVLKYFKYQIQQFEEWGMQLSTGREKADSLYLYDSKQSAFIRAKAMQKTEFLKEHSRMDLVLNTFSDMQEANHKLDLQAEAIYSMKKEIEQSESDYKRCKQDLVNLATKGFNESSRLYSKAVTVYFFDDPKQKDSLIRESYKHVKLFANRLHDLYRLEERVLLHQRNHYIQMAKLLKQQIKSASTALKFRAAAHESRLNHEQRRYVAYASLSKQMQTGTSTYKAQVRLKQKRK